MPTGSGPARPRISAKYDLCHGLRCSGIKVAHNLLQSGNSSSGCADYDDVMPLHVTPIRGGRGSLRLYR